MVIEQEIKNLKQEFDRRKVSGSTHLSLKEVPEHVNQLAQIEFTTGSSCGNVKIVMTGLGRLKDIVLKRGSLSDHEPEALSRIIASVIAKGEVISRDAISRLRDGKK